MSIKVLTPCQENNTSGVIFLAITGYRGRDSYHGRVDTEQGVCYPSLRQMDTLTKDAADLFKIAVNLAGFDALEVMKEIARRQRGRVAKANVTTVEQALLTVSNRYKGQ